MIRKKVALIIISIIVILAIRYNTSLKGADKADKKDKITIQMLREYVPAANSFEVEIYQNRWSDIYDAEDRVIASYTSSAGFTDHLSGYSGPVPVLIIADAEEQILGVELLLNRETPRYITVITRMGFFSSWTGLPAEQVMDNPVDTISGATLTTDAVIKGIHLRLSDIYNLLPPESGIRDSLRSIIINSAGYLFICFALLSYFVKRIRRYRIILLVFSVIIMGFLKGELLSIFYFYNLIAGGGIEVILSSMGLLTILAIILPLITNRAFYCHFVCPFGAAQELIFKAGHHVRISNQLRKKLSNIKYLWFGIIAVSIVLGISFDLSLIEPFSIFNFQTAHITTIVLSLITAAASLFISKPWCRFVCPTGTLLNLIKS